MDGTLSFQQQQFPDGECFGCGPSNPAGLLIDSFPAGDGQMVCDWTPRPEHSNGVGIVCGGVLSTALDCHAVTAALRALTQRDGKPPESMFTKEFTMQFLRPTPVEPIRLVARVTELRPRSAAVEATAAVNGEVCARFNGVFVVPRRDASK